MNENINWLIPKLDSNHNNTIQAIEIQNYLDNNPDFIKTPENIKMLVNCINEIVVWKSNFIFLDLESWMENIVNSIILDKDILKDWDSRIFLLQMYIHFWWWNKVWNININWSINWIDELLNCVIIDWKYVWLNKSNINETNNSIRLTTPQRGRMNDIKQLREIENWLKIIENWDILDALNILINIDFHISNIEWMQNANFEKLNQFMEWLNKKIEEFYNWKWNINIDWYNWQQINLIRNNLEKIVQDLINDIKNKWNFEIDEKIILEKTIVELSLIKWRINAWNSFSGNPAIENIAEVTKIWNDINSNSKILLIWVWDYIWENNDLDWTLKDVEYMNETLMKIYWIPKENITILTNNQASQQNILKTIVEIESQTPDNQRMIIYFAWHWISIWAWKTYLTWSDSSFDIDIWKFNENDKLLYYSLRWWKDIDMNNFSQEARIQVEQYINSLISTQEINNAIWNQKTLFIWDNCFAWWFIKWLSNNIDWIWSSDNTASDDWKTYTSRIHHNANLWYNLWESIRNSMIEFNQNINLWNQQPIIKIWNDFIWWNAKKNDNQKT